MYIRRVRTRNKTTGESYFTHRLVRTERIGRRVRQVTLLNLGRHFSLAPKDWSSLCLRIEEILSGQLGLLETFVETQRHRGTCYKAANWVHLGQTVGRGKKCPVHESILPIKDIWIYPLRKNFRTVLCQ